MEKYWGFILIGFVGLAVGFGLNPPDPTIIMVNHIPVEYTPLEKVMMIPDGLFDWFIYLFLE